MLVGSTGDAAGPSEDDLSVLSRVGPTPPDGSFLCAKPWLCTEEAPEGPLARAALALMASTFLRRSSRSISRLLAASNSSSSEDIPAVTGADKGNEQTEKKWPSQVGRLGDSPVVWVVGWDTQWVPPHEPRFQTSTSPLQAEVDR